MILLNGITGFNGEKEEVDGAQFKTICFTAIATNEGSILSFDNPGIATNFYKVKVEVFNEQIYIMLNRYYPIIAFASSLEYGNVHFIDHQRLAQAFSPFYRVLTVRELHEPLVMSSDKGGGFVGNHHNLNNAELQQIRYWKPARVGDVIYNSWD